MNVSGSINTYFKHTEVRCTANEKVRYQVLDSWRGISALLVVLFHFPAENGLSNTPFISSSFLFVDFFFVLSGFVIAEGYATRLKNGTSLKRFVLVRFGRLYPLHIFVLTLFVLFELMRMIVPALSGAGDPPFTGAKNLSSLVSNIFLLQGLGIENQLTWNAASWTISTEFFVSILFAFIVFVGFKKNSSTFFLLFILICPMIIYLYSPNIMDTSYDFGFVRCLYGFSIGVILASSLGNKIKAAHKILRTNFLSTRKFIIISTIEISLIVIIVLFLITFGREKTSIFAPFLFAIVIYYYAQEGGVISKLLLTKPFLWMGTISYSIYMIHPFIQLRIVNVISLIERKTGIELTGKVIIHGIYENGITPGNTLLGIIITLFMIVAVLICASYTWKFVEMPALNWFKNKAKRVN